MAFVPAAAAAEKRRQMRRLAEEEEDMTGYTSDDLRNDWEFKIVRSESGAFRKPEVVKTLLEEEARAGWVMLEKFDDTRIRFKRPRGARGRDVLLPSDVDPYRTRYGAPSAQYAVLAILLAGLAALGLGMIVLFREGDIGAPVAWVAWTVVSVIPFIVVLLGIVVVLIKRRLS